MVTLQEMINGVYNTDPITVTVTEVKPIKNINGKNVLPLRVSDGSAEIDWDIWVPKETFNVGDNVLCEGAYVNKKNPQYPKLTFRRGDGKHTNLGGGPIQTQPTKSVPMTTQLGAMDLSGLNATIEAGFTDLCMEVREGFRRLYEEIVKAIFNPQGIKEELEAIDSQDMNVTEIIKPAPVISPDEWLQGLGEDGEFVLLPGTIERTQGKALFFNVENLNTISLATSQTKDGDLVDEIGGIWVQKWLVEKKMDEIFN